MIDKEVYGDEVIIIKKRRKKFSILYTKIHISKDKRELFLKLRNAIFIVAQKP